MANSSITYSDLQAYRDYAEIISPDFLSKAYFGNQTAGLVVGHDGVKGKKILTQMILGELGRRYEKTFAPVADLINFKPRTLEVNAGKFEFAFAPQDFESTYLADLKRTGFDNTNELPFQGFMMMKIAAKMAQEIEIAMWQAKIPGTIANTDVLTQIIDGYLELVTVAIAASDLTPTAVTGGAFTTSNIIPTIESMWDTLDAVYQDMPIKVFLAPHLWKLYNVAYRENYGKYTDNAQSGRMQLDFCNAELIRTPGMGASNRIVMTPLDNVHYGYDDVDIASSLNFEKDHRELHFWSDFKMGVQFGFLEDGIVAVNDLA